MPNHSHRLSENSNKSSPRHQYIRDPTVRHAGRAHIRGKIRRVWRPRYLELLGSGNVRYYELPPTADVTLPEDSDWDHVNMIPKDTLVIFNARIIDVTTLRDLHVGLPGGSFGFLFRGQRQCTQELMVNPEPNPPREYFCAVSTLEEAQTWVVVLQWASTMGQKLRRHRSSFTSGNQNACSIEIINPPQERQQPPNSINPDQRKSEPSEATIKENLPPQKRPKLGRIVVPKVQGYRVVRSSTLHWDIAYEIALLLVQLPQIEERHILKTSRDLRKLVSQLEVELQATNDFTCKNVLDNLKQPMKELPEFQHGSRPPEITASYQSVEKILRTITRNAQMVNTISLKRCFMLDTPTSAIKVQRRIDWWQTSETFPIITYRNCQSIPSKRTDEFVRHWLAQKSTLKDASQNEFLCWWLQKPWLMVGGAGIVFACSFRLFGIYQRSIASFQIRADILILTWIVAFYSGKDYGKKEDPKQHQRRIQKRPESSSQQAATTTTNLQINNIIPEEDIEDDSDESFTEDGNDVDSQNNCDDITEKLSSPLPHYSSNSGESCWSEPPDNTIFRVRGPTYLEDRVKIPSGISPFTCQGVDLWMTDNPLRHIARHPSVMGGILGEEDTFLVNFLLPFGNFVSYFKVPPLKDFPSPQVADVWSKFIIGDQQYRDARLKLLPIVMDGPWIVKAAVGNGTAPALLGKVIPLQYYFQEPSQQKKGVYEVDVIITASNIAKGILSVVKGHTKSLTIAFAFIIEAAEQEELPETVLCSFQIHMLNLDKCPHLPECYLD